ncbi:MAG TPA: DUF2889 domain-containing protein [Methylomirabilota bacterium]|nr:DUF2889 domain-containing protein [Methylomirabilota bacterium]
MVPSSPYLADADRYERAMHGWVDVPEDAAFAITVRIADPWVGVELAAVTTPSPEYAIRAARGRVLVGPVERIDPALGEAMTGLGGIPMTPGYRRKVSEVAGGRPGASYFVDAAIEVARLARQVTRLPDDVVARHLPEGPVGAWRLDMQGWVDLPSSCYTYRPASERLFAERHVAAPIPPILYHPPRGAQRVFNRTKVARLERRVDQLLLSHAMFDEVHSFQIWYVVDAEGTVVDAGSRTPRLPYVGICDDAQVRVRELMGQRLDTGLRKRLGGLVGGTSGCAQLYDLTADLLRLVTLA